MKKSNIKNVEALRADFINFAFYTLIFTFLLAGCQKSNQSDEPLLMKIEQLTQEKTQLQDDLTRSNSKNEQLKKQVQVLSGLPENVKPDNLYRLQRVKIHRYTNLLDEDKDGKMEKLAVYVQPIDERGDIIKAAGSVNVQLWDLNQTKGEALLGQWSVEAEELKKRWVSFLVTNYRLTFELAEQYERFEKPLTVKVIFTDYLSGKVFNEQRVIEPDEK
ncbi:hypothetical protein ACFL5Z_08105 [Planctomycetota bacterium]